MTTRGRRAHQPTAMAAAGASLPLRRRPRLRLSSLLLLSLLLLLLCLATPAVANARGPGIVEVEVRGDASVAPTALSLDELEKAALAEERASSEKSAQKPGEAPPVESLIADFDNDGHVGSREIDLIKENLHHLFDIDDSGGIDTTEIQTMVKDDKDIQKAFQKLDRDHDSIISLQELDARWEAVGAEMTVSEVSDWVTFSVQLPQYAEMFREHSISGYTFPLLMQNDGIRLKEVGVEHDMHRQQLAMFLKMKYLGMGRKPTAATVASCAAEAATGGASARKVVLYVSWTPAENAPQRFQLQRRSPGESKWSLVYSGPDTEFMDVVDADQLVIYRLATWNSYGRSPHTFIRCDRSALPSRITVDSIRALPPGGESDTQAQGDPDNLLAEEDDSLFSTLKARLWWLDEAIALTLFIMLPIRGLIYGDANYVLRLLRRLPPNMPTRVTVEAEPSKTTVEDAAVTVSWEKPVDNGVPIVCYCVRWTRLKTDEMKWIKLLTLPLPTTVTIEHLRHGETYKFVVEATNEFGHVTKSGRSTYMVPVPELKGKLLPQRSINEATVIRNQCHICQDPEKRKLVPFTATLNRRILHFCCRCDREFCHHHKGEVFHTKALSCPAVDGRCICQVCKEKLLR